jgi:TonB-dependent SusC/RagA subfamily outer membrane receptor
MKNFTRMFCMGILFLVCSCANKVAPPQATNTYENPDLISNGYSKESPHNKTSSSSSVDAQNTIVGLDVYLRGLSGVTVTGDGASAQVVVHGVGSFVSSNEPLFILDGIVINGGYSSVYQSISSVDIKRVTVLKDAASTAIYGSRGGNGVIVITRKNSNVK